MRSTAFSPSRRGTRSREGVRCGPGVCPGAKGALSAPPVLVPAAGLLVCPAEGGGCPRWVAFGYGRVFGHAAGGPVHPWRAGEPGREVEPRSRLCRGTATCAPPWASKMPVPAHGLHGISDRSLCAAHAASGAFPGEGRGRSESAPSRGKGRRCASSAECSAVLRRAKYLTRQPDHAELEPPR